MSRCYRGISSADSPVKALLLVSHRISAVFNLNAAIMSAFATKLDTAAHRSRMGWMNAAEMIAATAVGSLAWARICELHPNEWVCLVEVENAPDGAIRSARVIGHDRSMRQALAQVGVTLPNTIVMHTWKRPLRSPRIEMTDEIRDIVRPRR